MNATAAAAERASASDVFLVSALRYQTATAPRAGGFFMDFDAMNLQSDDFELFGLPRRFVQERSAIDSRWKELQREAHPDRFAAQGAAAQRVAMQWSVRINEAYQRLKDPQRRAAYLCELHGMPIRAEDNTAMPPAFLMQQMEWREALEEAHTLAEMDALEREVRQAHKAGLERCATLIDSEQDFAAAAQQVRALMFIARFAQDVAQRQEQLGQ